MESQKFPVGPDRISTIHRYFNLLFSKKQKELVDAEENKPGFIGYSPVFTVALLKDILDLAMIGSFPGIGTAVTFCFSILIFLLLFFTRANKKLIDSRFLLRMVVVLICGSVAEGFLFGLNFLPIETITIAIIYLMDKNLSNEQIEKIISAISLLEKQYGSAIRAARGVERTKRRYTQEDLPQAA